MFVKIFLNLNPLICNLPIVSLAAALNMHATTNGSRRLRAVPTFLKALGRASAGE